MTAVVPKTDGRVTVPDAGEKIVFPVGFPAVDTELVVKQGCPGVRDSAGQWACVTHKLTFPNNLQASSHEMDGRHLVVWLCFDHGPEVP